MRYIGVIFLLLFVFSCSTKKFSTNKEVVSMYYSNNSCMNINENYICLNTQSRTNNFQKVLYKKQPINPQLYNISSGYKDNRLKELLKEKLRLSEKKLKKSTYNDNGGIREESYKEKYRPIYNRELSNQFNELLLKNIEEVEKTTFDEDLLLGIEKETLERLKNIMLKFFRKNSILISINNYNDISLHISKDVYEYIKKYHLEEVKELDMSSNIKKIYYKDIVKKNEEDIINIFYSRKNTSFTQSDIQKLNKKFSSLLSVSIKGLIEDSKKENKDFEYILSRGYQFFIDIFSISEQDKDKFTSLLNLEKLGAQLKIDRKFISHFYKKHPLKVFITQTNNYHPPHVDGSYGYLYINKKDVIKLKDKKLMKYLLSHEIKHVTYHFVSFKKQLSHLFTLLINLADNIMNNQTILIQEADAIIDSTMDLLAYYDNERRFSKQLPELSKILKIGVREGLNQLSKNYSKQKLTKGKSSIVKEFFSVQNHKKLTYLEEWWIDKGNLNKFNFKNRQLYYQMLKEILPKNHTRLKAIEKELILYKIKEEKFNSKGFELVVLLDASLEVIEKLPVSQRPEGLEEITEVALEGMSEVVDSTYTYLKELDNKSEMYYFLNDFYGINIDESEEQLLELLRYIDVRVKMRRALVNYARTSLTTGEL